jgi:hypothetical protein
MAALTLANAAEKGCGAWTGRTVIQRSDLVAPIRDESWTTTGRTLGDATRARPASLSVFPSQAGN